MLKLCQNDTFENILSSVRLEIVYKSGELNIISTKQLGSIALDTGREGVVARYIVRKVVKLLRLSNN